MKRIETGISGLIGIEPKRFGDPRGYFQELWNQRVYKELGVPEVFKQDNISCSKRGMLRGLHFQWPNPQGKLISVLRGSAFDVAVDLRPDSPTFKKWFGLELSEDNGFQLYIPQGFAHGFLSLTENTLFAYKCTEFYEPSSEKTLRWNDESIGINWPKLEGDYLLSTKDQIGKKLNEFHQDELFQ